MAKTITLKYPATCKDCGTALPVGASARWYGRGKVYGIGCHERGSAGGRGSRVLVSSRCEDYPCCGHGPAPQGDGGGCPKVYADAATGDQTEVFACADCGAELPPNSPSAVCKGCHQRYAREANA